MAFSKFVFFRPKTLSCKGKEVENVFNIRTPEDANRVVKLATSKNVIVVGASFLGELSSLEEYARHLIEGPFSSIFPLKLSLQFPSFLGD